MISHHTHLQENDKFTTVAMSSHKEKATIIVCKLITGEIMCSGDVQSNTSTGK